MSRNIRVEKFKVVDSTSVVIKFTTELDPFINTGNFTCVSNTPGVSDSGIRAVEIVSSAVKLTVFPLIPFASYFIELQSTDTQQFKSKNGRDYLIQDGISNKLLISGTADPANPIFDRISDNIINQKIIEPSRGTLSGDALDLQSKNLARAFYDVGQLKNDNYLSFIVYNEAKTRGIGPVDRLNEENAYEIIKVTENINGKLFNGIINYNLFTDEIITLQQVAINNEELVAGSIPGSFNGLTFNLKNDNIIKVNSIIINYDSGNSYIYNIEQYGYQILNSRYDTNFASDYLLLEPNQIKLSELVLDDDSFILPSAADTVMVSYQYKNLGKIINEDSVAVTKLVSVIREVTPPILNIFSLKHNPIVTDSDNIATQDGISFLDPQANPPFSQTHPAFQKEITFRLDSLPKDTGEFSINYEDGTVYVFGAITNDGTGDFPPTATYSYRKNYVNNLDYTYDPTTYELVASPLRDGLVGEKIKISFKYENTWLPYVDFIPEVHQEVINERVGNNLNYTNSLTVSKYPITNVFRILNETTGELYRLQRFTDNTIYFNYNQAPRVAAASREKASFYDVSNETLIVSEEITNTLGTKVFFINLANNKIIAASEDSIGSSFNSSVSFSRNDIFSLELYFDYQVLEPTDNYNKLSVGQYQIDYENGVIYLGVDDNQNYDLGTINYKKPIINPVNPHVISVSDIYYSITISDGFNKIIDYLSFDDGEIIQSSFEKSDERFLNNDETLPYVLVGDTITVTNNILNIRGIYDYYNLINSINPINFSTGSSFDGSVITLAPITLELDTIIQSGLMVSVNDIGPGAEIASVISIIRISDGVELYDSSGSFTNYDIMLSGINSPIPGEEVHVIYELKLNGSSTPIVDYNRGDLYINYDYIVDEIIVSYEYGDNCLNYTESDIDEGTEYYVTYRVGALRDSLLKNFGSLTNISILENFDTNLNRERYRDALVGALQSFTKGPTISSMKLLVKSISHIDPEIIESVFDNWSLGNSYLYENAIDYSNDITLMSGKYDNGILIDHPGQFISFPVSSNIKLEEGTLETWIIPEWNGLDNDATLTLSITRDDTKLGRDDIYIGSTGFHPDLELDGSFSISKENLNVIGLPTQIFTKIGLFIYFNQDSNKWNILAKEEINSSHYYNGTIISSGEVFGVKFIDNLKEINDYIRSTTNKIEFKFNLDSNDDIMPDGYDSQDGYVDGYNFDGLEFKADDHHYIFDFGESEYKNRFSIYKDGSGYLNFRIFDRGNSRGIVNRRQISANIQDWLAGEKHHVAVSWIINSSDRRDEMHLFIDGQEMPNISKWGGRPLLEEGNIFGSVNPEIIAGTLPKNIVVGTDLQLTNGSNTVSSDSIDFTSRGIVAGDVLEILELGLGTFTINSVAGGYLTLASTMSVTLEDAKFTINPYETVVSSHINLYKNIEVSIIRDGIETELPGVRAEIPAYQISKNALNQDVLTIIGDAEAGDQIAIRTLGLNHRRFKDRYFLWGDDSSLIKTFLPSPINLDEVDIRAVVLPLTSIGPSNSTIAGSDFNTTLTATQPSNSTEGRTLNVRITSSNVNFTNPVTVTINGSTFSGAVTEVFTFTDTTPQVSDEKWINISSVDIVVTPYSLTKNSTAIEIKENYALTYPDGNELYPVLRYSYKTQMGSSLAGTGTATLTDENGYFIDSNVGQKIVISSPGPVAGTYTIVSRISDTEITVDPIPAAFTSGSYSIYNISIGRSGFQNGYFYFELAGQTNVPYDLNEGFYEFDYLTYLELPFKPLTREIAYVGTDISNTKPASAVLDEFRILNYQLTDIRVGETLESGALSITTDYNSLIPFKKNLNTLMLMHFDSLPLVNDSSYYISYDKQYLQSSNSVNSEFGNCIVITDRPLIIDNTGYLPTTSEGAIEFWVSPRYDTYNDPVPRYYFDATGVVVEEIVSLTSVSVKLSRRASSVLSINLITDTENKINYFAGGSLQSDFQTIKLGRALPNQKTKVKVSYIPAGSKGDRLSIYKNSQGYLVFEVRANGKDFEVLQPIFWARDTWHRVRVTYKFNRPDNLDEIRLWADGEERGIIRFGLPGLVFSENIFFGQGFAGVDNSILTGDMNFRDNINKLYIGSTYLSTNTAQARIDNLKISNKALNPLVIAGQAKDINYVSNTNNALPAVPDLFTTYMLDFNTIITRNNDFTDLRSENYGIFNFDLNVIDSFDIVSSSDYVKQILETLVRTLKPAVSKVNINYFA